MIDKNARKIAHQILLDVEAKNLTNWDLENLWPETNADPALSCILRWLWTFYDDDEEIIIKKLLDDDSQTIFMRCVEFLKTDLEFELAEVTEEEARDIKRKWGVEWCVGCTLPDNDHWPFPKK